MICFSALLNMYISLVDIFYLALCIDTFTYTHTAVLLINYQSPTAYKCVLETIGWMKKKVTRTKFQNTIRKSYNIQRCRYYVLVYVYMYEENPTKSMPPTKSPLI